MSKNSPVIIAYIPVIHSGYIRFLRSHPEATTLYLFDYTLTQAAKYLYKDIRALELEQVQKALSALEIPQTTIEVFTQENINKLAQEKTPLIVPDEDITRDLIEQQLNHNSTTFDSIFLRWHRKNATQKQDVQPDVTVTQDQRDRALMSEAQEQASRSGDFWRSVGCVIRTQDDQTIHSRNTHLPSEHTTYINGSPRGCFSRGIELDKSSAIHAEALAIATAASKGISLKDAALYVTTFPCPSCAKLIAQTGISKLYFETGYSVLDGADVLRAAGVEIVQVSDHDA